MSGDLDLEQRYRRVLRLLPGYYRDMWEEDMVAAFLDSWLTGDPDEDSVTMEYDRPSRQEVVSVIGLAVRLYLGGAGVTGGQVSGRLHHALRAVPRLPRGPQRVLPQARQAGNVHLRGGHHGLPARHKPAARPVRTQFHPVRGRGGSADSHHHEGLDTRDQMAVSTAGKTWGVFMTAGPFTNGQFGILVQSENQALQLQRILILPG